MASDWPQSLSHCQRSSEYRRNTSRVFAPDSESCTMCSTRPPCCCATLRMASSINAPLLSDGVTTEMVGNSMFVPLRSTLPRRRRSTPRTAATNRATAQSPATPQTAPPGKPLRRLERPPLVPRRNRDHPCFGPQILWHPITNATLARETTRSTPTPATRTSATRGAERYAPSPSLPSTPGCAAPGTTAPARCPLPDCASPVPTHPAPHRRGPDFLG